MHNPKDFPEPEEFKPERFFENGQFQEHLIKIIQQNSGAIFHNNFNWSDTARIMLKFVLSPWEIEIVLENDLLRLSTLHLPLR